MLLQLSRIENESPNLLAWAEASLMCIDINIRAIKELVAAHVFLESADEITFFRELKPLFVSEFIFYSLILNIESEKPICSGKPLLKYYSEALENNREKYEQDLIFLSYYRRGATFLDHKYFMRNTADLKWKVPDTLYDIDLRFSTSHDHLISGYKAIEKLEKYMDERKKKEISDTCFQKLKPLEWSASKASLIELLYALHQMKCINGGSITMAEIIKNAELIFGIDLDNHKKILHEIKNRKILRAKFLHYLKENIEKHFEDYDF